MNKIIIVGHPFSGYRGVETLLQRNGVAAAQPSFQERITAFEVGATLCKAHGVLPLSRLTRNDTIDQISVGSVWNGMALDLLRGNLDSPLWCWSDPQAIYFLNYWKQLDPSLVFILVYNHPRTVLSRDPSGAYDLTSEDLDHRVHQWHVYNEALLHFYYRNRDNSLLLHSGAENLSGDQQLLQLLSGMIPLKNSRTDVPMLLQEPPVSQGAQARQDQNLPVVHRYWIDHFSADRENQLKQFLAGEVVSEKHPSLQLYEELQAVADAPEENSDHQVTAGALAAWRVFADLYKQSQILGEQSLEKQQYIDVLEHKRDLLENQVVEKQSGLQWAEKELQNFKEQIQEKDQELKRLQKREQSDIKELKQENELFLSQLHQVQEELERYFLENKEQKETIKDKGQQLKTAQEDKQSISQGLKQIEKEKQSLEEQVQGKDQELKKVQEREQINIKELKQENELLLSQLHQVQEELERYFLENRDLKANQKPVYYGAAERVKSELAYQLGAAMIERGRQLWPLPFLPVSMWRITRRFCKKQKASTKTLPPLGDYRDFHEAEKVQKHLSYRLGAVWLKHIRTPWGWLIMPFALLGAHGAYRRDRKILGK